MGQSMWLYQHLPNGGKPPATDDEGLRTSRDSNGMESPSVAVILLPAPLGLVKLCQKMIQVS